MAIKIATKGQKTPRIRYSRGRSDRGKTTTVIARKAQPWPRVIEKGAGWESLKQARGEKTAQSRLALALVAHSPQQLSLLVLSHLLTTLLDYAAHGWISMLGLLEGGEI